MRKVCMNCRFGLLGMILSLPAMGADKVTIREAIEPGMTWTFHHTQEILTNSTATLNGQSTPFGQKMHSMRSGKAEVLTAVGGAPTSIRVTFGDDCETLIDASGRQQKLPFPYTGKTITLTRGEDGKITDDFKGQADEASAGELHAMIEQEAILIPSHPIAPGEEWSPDPAALSRLMQLKGERDRAGMTLKLLGVKEISGRGVAEVKVSIVLQTAQQQNSMQLISQGTALVDLQTGHTVKTEMKGSTKMAGRQNAPDQSGAMATYAIEGKGTIETVASSEITGGGGGHAQAPPAEVQNPLNPVVPHPNPNAVTFVGKYSDGKMSLDLNESPDGYTGTIELANQKYPATAKANGAALEGSFEAGGNRFPFAATLENGVLKFVTANTTYSLKKTVANPLDNVPANPLGPPTPPNPLAPAPSQP